MTMLYLIATIAGQRIAIAAEGIESVVEIAAIAPVPCVPPHIAGLAALRSRVLTIVDCRQSLQLDARPPAAAARAIVITIEAHRYGLLVDDVDDVVAIPAAPRPAPLALLGGWARGSRGIVEHEGEMLLLLDPVALIDGPPAIAA